MSKVLISVIALMLGISATSVSATPISHELTINAVVDPGCTANAPTGTTGFNGSGTTFTTAVTGTSQAPASGDLTFGNLVCTTTGVKVTLSSLRLGLFIPGTESISGAKKMNYQAKAKLNSTTLATLNTQQGVASTNGQSTLATGSNNIKIEITFPGTTQELIPNGALAAGTYSDKLTINIDGIAI